MQDSIRKASIPTYQKKVTKAPSATSVKKKRSNANKSLTPGAMAGGIRIRRLETAGSINDNIPKAVVDGSEAKTTNRTKFNKSAYQLDLGSKNKSKSSANLNRGGSTRKATAPTPQM